MEEAKDRLSQLRDTIMRAQKAATLTRSDFDQFAKALYEIAVEIFGPTSAEVANLNTKALSSSQLTSMGKRAKSVPLTHAEGNVTRIERSPPLDQSEYYRKRLSGLVEEITTLLLALRDL